MSIHREDDGSYVMYHVNKQLEAIMDKDFDRWPGEKRWSPKRTGPKYTSYADIHHDQRAVIVGKGPGLDQISADDFTWGDVVICCNDSVHHTFPISIGCTLYSVQLDENMRDTCKCKHAQHFISAWAKDWIPNAVILSTSSSS